MDRYKVVKGKVYQKSDGRFLSASVIEGRLNTLERELAAANAKIEKAPHDDMCQLVRCCHCDICLNYEPHDVPHEFVAEGPCNCWKSED